MPMRWELPPGEGGGTPVALAGIEPDPYEQIVGPTTALGPVVHAVA